MQAGGNAAGDRVQPVRPRAFRHGSLRGLPAGEARRLRVPGSPSGGGDEAPAGSSGGCSMRTLLVGGCALQLLAPQGGGLQIFKAWLEREHPGYGSDEGPARFRNAIVEAAYPGRGLYYALAYPMGIGIARNAFPLGAHINHRASVLP